MFGQTLVWKNAIFTCIWNCSFLQNGELSFPNGRNSISWYFLSQSPKCRFILFQYTNVFLCAKFGVLKRRIDEKRRPEIWTCFWARHRNKIAQGNCDFLSTKCFININWSSRSTECAAENSKPRVMLQDQRGEQPSKICLLGTCILSLPQRLCDGGAPQAGCGSRNIRGEWGMQLLAKVCDPDVRQSLLRQHERMLVRPKPQSVDFPNRKC